jgi:hypothetical protein
VKTISLEEKLSKAKEFLRSIRVSGKKRAKFAIPRETFDPVNVEHLESYRLFLMTGRWGAKQFYIEYPFDTVIETITKKFCLHQLEKILGPPSTDLLDAHQRWLNSGHESE